MEMELYDTRSWHVPFVWFGFIQRPVAGYPMTGILLYSKNSLSEEVLSSRGVWLQGISKTLQDV